ncbi:HAD-IIIC family phosphatase [Puniceicoccaceae bacterium K14]|nr:HAD-IIIC family phosphatase [Puniceicoccaceae bacterium K14]
MEDEKLIKCIVWDLDNTVWEGVLLEDGGTALRDGVAEAVRSFDERGILQSVSSRNDFETAMSNLKRHGLDDYFLYPEINWNAKSESIKRIAENLNLGLDSFVFIDDQEYEREEVLFSIPEVRCVDAFDLNKVLEQVSTTKVTAESRSRRSLYQQEAKRKVHEESFEGDNQTFQKSLGLKFTIFEPSEADLSRASELTIRTHQLNTTGISYSEEDLKELLGRGDHIILLAKLTDRFGEYGTIGVAVVERTKEVLDLKLLLMSCRVMSRGVGTVFLLYLMQLAKKEEKRFLARFLKTERNRMMYITYKMNGFFVSERDGANELLEHDLEDIQTIPDYVELDAPDIEILEENVYAV